MIRPAVAVVAPRSRAVSATIGAIAPLPISYTSAGRNTAGIRDRSVTAMVRDGTTGHRRID
jgi:hypothetical protein